jgi:endonuclease/exonuclease/phosphatase family metal-dependent hydrolase
MRTPKNRLHDLEQKLHRPVQKESSAQGKKQKPAQSASVEAMSFDNNEPIDLRYDQKAGGYVPSSPTYATAHSLTPDLGSDAEAFKIEPFDEIHLAPPTPADTNSSGSSPVTPDSAGSPARAFEIDTPVVEKGVSVPDKATESDEFLENLQAISRGEKTYDGDRKQVVDAATSAPKAETKIVNVKAEPPVQAEVVSSATSSIPTKSAAPSAQAFDVDTPTIEQVSVPDEVVTEDDFLEDLQAILNGEKTFDSDRKQAVNKSTSTPNAEQLSVPSSSSPAPVEPSKQTSPHDVFDRMAQGVPPEPKAPTPAPTYSNAHSVFDRMGKNMAFANSFDLGTISLDQRFDKFDQILKAEEKQSQIKALPEDFPSHSSGNVSSSISAAQSVSRDSVANANLEHLAAEFSGGISEAMSGESIKIWLASWNCENQAPTDEMLEQFIIPDLEDTDDADLPDLIVIALQEAMGKDSVAQRLGQLLTNYEIKKDAIQDAIGATKSTFNYQQLAVLCRRSIPIGDIKGGNATNVEGKGGCYVSFNYPIGNNQSIKYVKLGFIGAHLDSKKEDARNRQIDGLLRSINPAPYKNEKEITEEFFMSDFDGVFFMGDLNYRLIEEDEIKKDAAKNPDYFIPRMMTPSGLRELLTMDSIRKSPLIERHKFIFPDPEIPFLPTYKRNYEEKENNPCSLLARAIPLYKEHGYELHEKHNGPIVDENEKHKVDEKINSNISDLMQKCYFSKPNKLYSSDRQAYDLGWLDRVGYKLSKPFQASALQQEIYGGRIKQIDVREFKSYDGIVLSDHTPILMKVEAIVAPSELQVGELDIKHSDQTRTRTRA